MTEQLLGIDWGSTNRRAYLVTASGSRLLRHEDDRGILAENGQFAASLNALRTQLGVSPDIPVVMSGMVGSAQGWQEVAYLGNHVSLGDLPRSLSPLQDLAAGESCFIVPGYYYADHEIDVMRGEETQLLGALALGHGSGWVVLPGTHSKWVYINSGRMAHWSTYMTGEMFAMLSREGTLSSLLRVGVEHEDMADFDAGIVFARKRLTLTNALFSVRARVVSGAMPATKARAFVSGLLIGTEFVGAQDSDTVCESITLIGSDALVQRYARAASLFNIAVKIMDPHDVYCAALSRIFVGVQTQGNFHAR